MNGKTLKARVERIELGLNPPATSRLVINPEDYGGDMDEAWRQARIRGAIAVVPRKCETDEEWIAEVQKRTQP